MHDLARQMRVGGNSSLIPGQDIPNALLNQSIPIIPSRIPPLLPLAHHMVDTRIIVYGQMRFTVVQVETPSKFALYHHHHSSIPISLVC